MSVNPNTYALSESHSQIILVVDDDPANLGVVSDFLKDFDFRILVARDGESALRKAQRGQPDLILLDVMMPGIDGFETCRRLKANEDLRDIPVLFMTALTDVMDKVKGFQAGGMDYITKPFQVEEVLARVQTHLALHAMHEQLTAQNVQLHQEVAERRQADEALRESEARYHRLFEQTQVTLAETQALYRVSRSVIALESLAEMLQTAVDTVAEALPADRVTLITFNLEAQQVTHFVKGGPGADQVIHVLFDELWNGLSGWVLRESRPALSPKSNPDPRESLEVQRRRAETHCGDIIVVPLRYQDKTLGTMTAINTPNGRAFTEHDVELMMAMANQAAMAIENARLYDELQLARAGLEQRVEERTAELMQANARLTEEIAERKRAEEALRRSNRELRAISSCNQTLLRALDEQTLLNEICRIVCDEAGYRMAWVGYAENDDAKTVHLAAWAGNEAGVLANANLTWADTERGRGPTGTAIRSGESACIQDFTTDPQAAPWRETALQHGCRSSIAMPLKNESAKTFGVLNIYSTEPNAFTSGEIRLLEELAGDLAFGIVVLRARAERKRAEETLRQSEELLRVTLTNILDPVFITDNDGKLTFICPNVLDTLGYSVEEIQALGNISKLVGDDLFNPKELEMRGEIFNIEKLIIDNLGRQRVFLVTVKRVSIGEGTRLYALHDITERKQAEKVRETLYEISQAVISADKLEDLYHSIHNILSGLITAENFFIAFYDPSSDLLSFPYFVDHFDAVPAPRKPGRGLTEYVLRTGHALLASPEVFYALVEQGEVELVGSPSIDWLGMPLRVENRVIGVMAVQSYTEHLRYGKKEMDIMEFVSTQVAIGIERKRSFEEIRQHIQQLNALRTIDVALTSSFDLRLNLSVLLEQVITQLAVDAADVLLLNPYTLMLEYAAGRGFHTRAVEGAHIRLGESFAGIAALEHRAVQLDNLAQIQENPQFAAFWAGEGVAAYYAVPLIAKGQVKGVLEVFHRAPLAAERGWVSFLEALAGQAAIAIENAQLFEHLQRSNVDLVLAYDATIEGWARALDLRDKETEGHTRRVAELTERLARVMGMSEGDIVHARRGAILHDIGKMAVPDSILLKPDKLTAEEWVLMRQHPQNAFDMLTPIAFLRPALDIPYCHHEKWDGTGYPRGLKGEQIPLAARLFAVIDVYDALISDRLYRAAWSREKTLEYIESLAGTHFDPMAVELFIKKI